MIGKVISYSDFNGYGFIENSSKQSFFVHVSQIHREGLKTLESGETVEFTPCQTMKGWQANDVKIIHTDKQPAKPNITVLKKNPFTPQDPITDADKFAGRNSAIINSLDNLFNGKNVLISGPRGIGKSSLAYQLLYTTNGDVDLLERVGLNPEESTFNNLICDHRCMPGNTLYDIANGLVNTALLNAGRKTKIESRKNSAGINLKYFSLSTETTERSLSPSDISLKLASEIENIFNEYGFDRSGITFLIDEIDILDKDLDIASFLKATFEKLRLNYHKNVCMILAGVTGTVTELINQHPSSNRLFENIILEKMSTEEQNEVISLHLKDTGVSITDEARISITNLSNAFPQPIHLLGYHSFKSDGNNIIELDDVELAKDHIVQTLKKQEFDSKFVRLDSGKTIEIIRRFATSRYETVTFNFLKDGLRHLTDREIYGILGNLEDKQIIERVHKHTYKFTEPLFKIYIQWIFGIME